MSSCINTLMFLHRYAISILITFTQKKIDIRESIETTTRLIHSKQESHIYINCAISVLYPSSQIKHNSNSIFKYFANTDYFICDQYFFPNL